MMHNIFVVSIIILVLALWEIPPVVPPCIIWAIDSDIKQTIPLSYCPLSISYGLFFSEKYQVHCCSSNDLYRYFYRLGSSLPFEFLIRKHKEINFCVL